MCLVWLVHSWRSVNSVLLLWYLWFLFVLSGLWPGFGVCFGGLFYFVVVAVVIRRFVVFCVGWFRWFCADCCGVLCFTCFGLGLGLMV